MPRSIDVLLAMLLVATACGDASSTAAEAPRPAPTAPTRDDPEDGDRVPAISYVVAKAQHPALAAIEEELARTLAVAPLPEARRPAAIAWTTPACPSTYAFDARLKMHLLAPEEATNLPGFNDGLAVEGTATMGAREGGGAVVRYGEIELGLLGGDVKRPGNVQPAGTLAETRLSLDGDQWIEVDGPTSLWSAYGSFPGLVVFFPGLPGDRASAAWTIPLHEQAQAGAVEAERGAIELPAGYVPPKPDPHRFAATVQLDGWLDVAGAPVAVLSATWSDTLSGGLDAVTMKTEVAFTGRYAVLACGRLLYASVQGTTHVEMSGFGKAEPMKQRHELVADAWLTESCDGPVLVPPVKAIDPEAELLRLHAELRNAAVGGDRDAVVAPLAPEIVFAHGRDAIADLLFDHARRLGPFALGTPEVASETQRDGDRITARMTGSADGKGDARGTVHTIVEGELRDGKLVITRIATGLHSADETSVLEITKARLHSADPD